MKKLYSLLSVLGILGLTACEDSTSNNANFSVINPQENNAATLKNFKLDDYWYQGKAEISSYDLQQARYTDIHPGEAVLIFVTEDFLTDKQVKNDNYTNKNSTPILKNNRMRQFTTGIYDYSVMTSVFTPTDISKYPKTQKVTLSSQDWCGQSFMQINQKGNKYTVQFRSYFENEGDEDFSIAGAILEDEIFNRIRMNPSSLPTGNVQLIPASAIATLMHLELKPINANITKADYTGNDFEGNNLAKYHIEYPTLNRAVTIIYQKEAPYIIEGWMDTYRGKTTKAIRKKTVLSPYWQQNGKTNITQRKELDLSTFE